MTTQPEQILENNVVAQLEGLGYQKVVIRDEDELLANLKSQLEKHNKVQLSQNDFTQILNYINKGNVFERAKILRDRVPYTNAQGEVKTVELINQIHWCQNEFQVTQQITMEGTHKNRYDVTILINGLPLVQIELKRRGLELKEAFNQTNRYERHSYGAGHGLFQFVQIFVISNGVNTKYYANSPLKARSFKQTFYWADENNRLITQLAAFSEVFLEPCHISKMITKYTVLNESQKMLMVLRPYQFYAVEHIVERVKTTTKYGYIWHTTGSGKTLTSFKAAQILTNLKEVHKVVFVVDRKDLDYQTTKEFNAFSKGSIDGTNNTNTLVKQLAGDNKLIVTTIQKLNTAISKTRYLGKMEALKNERIVFIFDECHRSQFGKTHEDIKKFFSACQMFGFTGTPIFEDNAGTNQYGKRTTKMLFGDCLHKYVITDAIRDGNVLKFSVEYIRTFKKKDDILDINVEAIDEAEVMDAPVRLDNITEYIIANHNRKTHSREFTAIFCVSSVPILIEYYKLFLRKKEEGKHNLRLATIFSYAANEEDKDAVGFVDDDEFLMAAEPKEEYHTQHTRDELEDFIKHYNRQFGTNYTSKDNQSYYNYYNDIAKRVKHRQIDVLVVVNMFLTGFDSKHLNTLYVDKNLKYHGLIQAYSRTNRILNEVKSQGNIVCFRNLKEATDEAITLFSNKNAIEEIIMQPYEEYVTKFNQAFVALLQIAPTVNSVNELPSEEEELAFIQAFRELMRLKNVLATFTEFQFDDLSMTEQTFEDYKSKYLDLYDKAKGHNQKEKVSILGDIDFELELIHRDEINVAYILKLLAKLKDAAPEEQEKQKKALIEIVAGDAQLRSKRELIEKFIQENLPHISDSDDIPDEFESYWNEERKEAMNQLSKEENLDKKQLQEVIGKYIFTEKKPLRDDVIGLMNERPALKERATVAERVTQKIITFVETFISGIHG
ncbi:MAG: type I restriction endonuclease subunit R [Muricauda sp.]|nr:type I restriction endonuclease subunit R [Allomuricauda sp.]MBO6532211.1 type I restriction endonuclease subunit R [Allomuricauda sp.]MBO6590091.1 type I restriction endonuclease subunit R [Allomuricauda sp.]MBO6619761.1 type I restriction endonuclease subunit R [Allomuricauda sp.]MBO6645612.1 type I restriction endonuclease subunit R [Allomuricauda sp.]MBO6748099.1 type I restriction endonuclease subunit R [Allomuricauda sp.]